MKKHYDQYGVPDCDVDATSNLVSKALGIEMEAHESYFMGGEYFQYGDGEESIEVRPNHDFDPEPYDNGLPASATLIDVASMEKSQEIEKKLRAYIPSLVRLQQSRA